MKEIVFITGNEDKVAQLSDHFSMPLDREKINLPETQSSDVKKVAEEKAIFAYQQLKRRVLVEDTSLTFNAFGYLPGPFVKWFLEAPGVGNEGMVKMLDSFQDRTAYAEACYAVCDESGVKLFYGRVDGCIASAPIGDNGIGWDPIFIPDGQSMTFAQMSKEQQYQTSMRKIALEKLGDYLVH